MNLLRYFRVISRIDSAPSSFREFKDAIEHGGWGEGFVATAGPSDLDGIEMVLRTEAEVEAEVAR
jgi:hypothetical protein